MRRDAVDRLVDAIERQRRAVAAVTSGTVTDLAMRDYVEATFAEAEALRALEQAPTGISPRRSSRSPPS